MMVPVSVLSLKLDQFSMLAVADELVSSLGDDDNWLLAYDAFTEFLMDSEILRAANEPAPVLRYDGAKRFKAPTGSCASPMVKTRGRALHSDHVSTLRQEIDGLHRQLKRLHHDLCSQAAPRQTNWKLRAASELILEDHAVDQNRQLKQRVAANEEFLKSVKNLLSKQSDDVASDGPHISIALGDDGSRVYGMLRAALDARQYQLEASMRRRLPEIANECTAGPQDLTKYWRIKTLGRGIRMEMTKAALLPFTAAEYIGIVSKYTELDKIPRIHDHVRVCHQQLLLRLLSLDPNGVVLANQVVDKVTQRRQVDTAAAMKLDSPAGSAEIDARTILRRVSTDHGTLIMWETMSFWQTHDSRETPQRAIVRESGWSVIAPFCNGEFGNSSIARCEVSASINSADGSKMRQSDPLARGVISTIQNVLDQQSRNVENLFLDHRIRVEKRKQQQEWGVGGMNLSRVEAT